MCINVFLQAKKMNVLDKVFPSSTKYFKILKHF